LNNNNNRTVSNNNNNNNNNSISVAKGNLKDVERWTAADVARKMRELGVADYAAFENEAVDGASLVLLTEDDLKNDLDLKLGDRKKVMQFLNEI
jgi:hypothetical protein